MSNTTLEDRGEAFLALMRRYVVNYTNAHDQSQTATIMEEDYTLRMGKHLVAGRDTGYAQATRKQMDQFPGLGLTVHEIWTSGERLVMRFSEHGASKRHAGTRATWGGIGLYRWNGRRLTANIVEQDYQSRARQLESGEVLSPEPPAVAPWDSRPAAPDTKAVAIITKWLHSGTAEITPEVKLDDQRAGCFAGPILDQRDIVINDIFSCGSVVAFHASITGHVLPDAEPPFAEFEGKPGTLHLAGIVHLENAEIVHGTIIRNRLGLMRGLAQ